jgi:ketosteroid isomerase-like protein
MRTTLFLVCLLVFGMTLIAQSGSSPSALQKMVATEQAFAKASEEKGTRESFMMFIAEDGILFRPGPEAGKKWMQQNPVPASDKRPLLAWQPIFADMAAAGDMGYTFGPWEFKADIKDPKPTAFGHFATIWKRQPDGTFKFAIDLGISHPNSATPAVPWQPEEVRKATGRNKIAEVDVAATREALTNHDREFSKASATQGALKSFQSYAAENVRLFRNGHFPFVGKPAIAAALAENKGVLTWQPSGTDVSRSGDLGYTYGLYEIRTGDSAHTLAAKGNYMRFWKKQGDAWRVVLDVDDPLPLEEKKN